jgi:Ran GTPase-activating protein (RanGAP) involved in mRNA processing and transport
MMCSYLQALVASTTSESDLITINVQTLSGSLPPIIISLNATVRDLKLRVQALNADFRVDRQKLVLSDPSNDECVGVVLLNHQTLHSYQITDSTNVALVMQPKSDIEANVEVCLDKILQDTTRFTELLSNRELYATSIDVDSIDQHQELLLELFVTNRVVKSVQISGSWTREHLQFCKALLNLRPDIDIRFVVNRVTDARMIHFVVNFCNSNRCSSFRMVHNVSSCWMSNEERSGFVSLSYALRSMSSLQILNLSNNAIGDAGCALLVPALQSMSSLQHLDLSLNEIGAAGCASLAPALQSISSLQILNLSYNDFGDAGCASLAPALQSMSLLHVLDLSHNKFGAAGCSSLASALQSMSSLTALNLSHNDIGDKSCASLATALQSMSSLCTLDLSYNFIGDAGCAELAPALMLMSSLQNFQIRSNRIKNAGCVSLAPALQSMSSLQTLGMSLNKIGDAGCAALASALPSMPSLQTLDLDDNMIGAEGCRLVRSSLPSVCIGLWRQDMVDHNPWQRLVFFYVFDLSSCSSW